MNLPAPTPRPRAFRRDSLAIVAGCVAVGALVGLAVAVIDPLILLALVPVVIVGAWALRSPEHGLLLTIAVIALVPRVSSPVSIGFKPTLLDAALVLTFVAWLVQRGRARRDTKGALPLAVPLLALIGVAVVTFIAGIPNGALTTLVVRRFAEFVGSLAMVFVFYDILRDESVMARAVRAFIVLGALSALVGIGVYALSNDTAIRLLSSLRPFSYPYGPDVLRFIRDDPTLMKRATGLWIDPNAFGGFLLMTAALTLAQVFGRAPVLRRGIVAACLGLTVLAMALTVSRSAMLGLAAAAVFMGALRYRKLLPWLAVVVVVMLVLPQTNALMAHFAEGFAGRDLATQMRFGEYKDAFRLIERYPVFGVGFADTPDVDLYIGVSSMYLLMAQQMGLVGAVVFAVVLVAIVVNAVGSWPRVRDDDARAAVWLGAHAAILGALVSGIFDHYFFNIDFHNSVVLFWLIVALAMASSRRERAAATTIAERRADFANATTILGHANQPQAPEAS